MFAGVAYRQPRAELEQIVGDARQSFGIAVFERSADRVVLARMRLEYPLHPIRFDIAIGVEKNQQLARGARGGEVPGRSGNRRSRKWNSRTPGKRSGTSSSVPSVELSATRISISPRRLCASSDDRHRAIVSRAFQEGMMTEAVTSKQNGSIGRRIGMIDFMTRAVARLGRRRRYRFAARPVQVNLGSGLYVAPGWINVDMGLYSLLGYLPAAALRGMYRRSGWTSYLSEDQYVATLKTNRFIQHDVRNGLPFDDDSVDALFASHFLDSLTRMDGELVIKEARRILRPGGRIRILVSDIERNIELYRSGRKGEALALFFPASDSRVNLRYTMYDYETLSSLLSGAGFTGITRCEYRKGAVPDLDILDNRPDESLFVEAVKP